MLLTSHKFVKYAVKNDDKYYFSVCSYISHSVNYELMNGKTKMLISWIHYSENYAYSRPK